MGMHLSVYIGPHFLAPKDFDWYSFESVVCDGRMEAGSEDEHLVLIPNCKLDGINRKLIIERDTDSHQAQGINPAMIVRETAAFHRAAKDLIRHCDENGIEIREGWGVVPCWS